MNTKIVLVHLAESDQANRKSVSAEVVRVLATYPHGLLVEINEEQSAALEGQGRRISQAHSNQIKLRTVTLDTSQAPPRLPARLSRTPGEQKKKRKREFWIVQFVGPVKKDWKSQLEELGIKIKNYVPENAYLVEMSTETVAQLQAMPFVSWVGLYEPAYKVSPLLMGHKRPARSDELATRSIQPDRLQPTSDGNVTILLHDPVDMEKVKKAVTDLGGAVVKASRKTIIASLDHSSVEQIAKMVEVSWLEPFALPKLCNNVAAGIMGVQQVWDWTGLDGRGQIVAVADTGLDVGEITSSMHSDFAGRIVAIHDWGKDGADDTDGHGTHVAGSVLGDGSRSDGQIRGMAPAARLVFQALKDEKDKLSTPADYHDLFQQAYDDGARIHTNSWGGNPIYFDFTKDPPFVKKFSIYVNESSQIDKFIWDHKDVIILFAASNEGVDADQSGEIDSDSLSVQACAKNSVTVGATENNRPSGSTPPPGSNDQWHRYVDNLTTPIIWDHVSDNAQGLAAFSSRGPTDDGRIKPDVVAPGTNILSVRSSKVSDPPPLWGDLAEDNPLHGFYCWSGGTSMSTPLAAGVVALIRQYVMDVRRHTPSGALLKALLIHGATSITGQYLPREVEQAPDNNQGWGRVNLMNSLYPLNYAQMRFQDNTSDALDTGEEREYVYNIGANFTPFRATLVWTDFPGSVWGSVVMVNELRLEVTQPNGTILIGEPQNNNVQQVLINFPPEGEYRVRVSGFNVPEGPQDFALVVSAVMDLPELYIRENNSDSGGEPRREVEYESPDIWISAENNPNLPGLSHLESGKANYVFVRVRNQGVKQAIDAKVTLYWAYAGTHLNRPNWRTDGIKMNGEPCNHQFITVPPATLLKGKGSAVTAAFECTVYPVHDSIEPGNYYLIATVTHPDDDIPQEDAGTIRWNNNIASSICSQKNGCQIAR